MKRVKYVFHSLFFAYMYIFNSLYVKEFGFILALMTRHRFLGRHVSSCHAGIMSCYGSRMCRALSTTAPNTSVPRHTQHRFLGRHVSSRRVGIISYRDSRMRRALSTTAPPNTPVPRYDTTHVPLR